MTLTSLIQPDNIKVDRQVVDFYNKIQQQGDTQVLLTAQKKIFAQKRILDLFGFNKLTIKCDDWIIYLKDSDSPNKNAFLKIGQSIKTLLEDLDKTGLRFRQQLIGLFNDESDPGRTDLLFERLAKGITYYTDQLYDNAITLLEEKYEEYKKVKSSILIKNMMSLNYELWHHINELYALTYQNQKAYLIKPKHQQKVFFDPNKKAPKKVKGATYDLTYELFKAGQTIDQIAKKRSLAFTTVESHMTKLLQDDKITIKELMTQERMNKIYPLLVEHIDLELSDMRNKIPFYTSYSELRWLRTWYKKTGADKVK